MQNLTCYQISMLLLLTSLTSGAAYASVLTAEEQLDVAQAKLAANELHKACTAIADQRQAFQCKSTCGTLGDKVQGMFITLNRHNAPKQALISHVKQYMSATQACAQLWRNKAPSSFAGFAELFNFIKAGKLPQSGAPLEYQLDNPAKFSDMLGRLQPELATLPAICENSLFIDTCKLDCQLADLAEQLASQLIQMPVAGLQRLNEVTADVVVLDKQAAALRLKSSRCKQHFGRDPARALLATENIANQVWQASRAVHLREAAEKRRQYQIALAKQQAEAAAARQARQQAYLDEIKAIQQCSASSPFAGMQACSYLQALYDGDIETMRNIEKQFSLPYRAGWMADLMNEAGLDQLFGPLYEQAFKSASFVTPLAEVYNSYYSAFYPNCLGPDPVKVEMTTERELVYKNGFGYKVSSAPYAPKIDKLLVPRRLYEQFGTLGMDKDLQATEMLADMIMGAVNQFPRISVFDVTMGLTQAMEKYQCDSPVMKKFEQQLITFYQRK